MTLECHVFNWLINILCSYLMMYQITQIFISRKWRENILEACSHHTNNSVKALKVDWLNKAIV